MFSFLASCCWRPPSHSILVRPREKRWRNRQAQGFGSLEVDDQLELLGPLDGKIRWRNSSAARGKDSSVAMGESVWLRRKERPAKKLADYDRSNSRFLPRPQPLERVSGACAKVQRTILVPSLARIEALVDKLSQWLPQ